MDGNAGQFMMDGWINYRQMDGNIGQFRVDGNCAIYDGQEFWTIYDGQIDGNFGHIWMDGLTFLSLAVQLSILSVTTRLVVILAQTCNKSPYFKTLTKLF